MGYQSGSKGVSNDMDSSILLKVWVSSNPKAIKFISLRTDGLNHFLSMM